MGCVQEEILFLIFPEAIISMFIVPQMADNEAISIYGMRRYSNYKNYSYNIEFDGAYVTEDPKEFLTSVMIAVDATDFNGRVDTQLQFNKESTFR